MPVGDADVADEVGEPGRGVDVGVADALLVVAVSVGPVVFVAVADAAAVTEAAGVEDLVGVALVAVRVGVPADNKGPVCPLLCTGPSIGAYQVGRE